MVATLGAGVAGRNGEGFGYNRFGECPGDASG